MTLRRLENNDDWAHVEGTPAPLGVTWVEDGAALNFALYSRYATSVTLLCYRVEDPVQPALSFLLTHSSNKTGRVWHCRIAAAALNGATLYAYKVQGPYNPANGDRFDGEKILLDPYARAVHFPDTFSRAACSRPGPTDGLAPLGELPRSPSAPVDIVGPPVRHTHDAIVYELHIKGFTVRPNSGVVEARRGTFAGLIDKIPYLLDLGVTIVELMPVHQFDPQEGNYWGYMTMGFFAPHRSYAEGDPIEEFRRMVDAFHAAGIEVWLDVVYNHTTEGNQLGPTYSMRGIGNSAYYLLNPDSMSEYINESGAGNTTRCAHPAMRELVIDSLTYWAVDMKVDGFRFDLASILSLSNDGRTNLDDPPVIAEIGALASHLDLALVAEAWDIDSYQLGRSFPGITWAQWNGKFRDDVRQFIKGDGGLVGTLMQRLYGSDDLFPDTVLDAYRPFQSVNFITAHDGLCLYDLVSYTRNDHRSWDCGWEGDHALPSSVLDLRRRQIKNFCCLTMLANGVPMFVAGDEFMNTQGGNDNPYNQDNETTWLDWDLLERNADVHRFFKLMIAFRKDHPTIARSRFWRDDVSWYGTQGGPDLGASSHTLAYCLHEKSGSDDDIYVMINTYWHDLQFSVHEGAAGDWLRVVDTGLPSPEDIASPGEEPPLAETGYLVRARSIVVLRRSRQV